MIFILKFQRDISPPGKLIEYQVMVLVLCILPDDALYL